MAELIGFHITYKSSLKSILTKGLLPKIGARSKMLGEKRPAVFLFMNEVDAEQCIMNDVVPFDEERPISLLKIVIPENFPCDAEIDSMGCYAVYSPIPPECIEVYKKDYE